MKLQQNHNPAHKHIVILYHSAAGGTRIVAQLLGELLSTDYSVKTTSIYDVSAVDEAQRADFVVLCYPTYFLKPSTSMKEFVERLASTVNRQPAYLVTTYELYTENSLRICALSLKAKGIIVTGSAAIRAPGSDLACVFPDWLSAWLYRFQPGFPRKLWAISHKITELVQHGGRERIPRLKWYTLLAQPLQRAFLNGFFEWRDRIRILSDRCTDCGACISRCHRGAWVREEGVIRHRPERCEFCTGCIHHCNKNAIVLINALRDNRRLNERHYAALKSRTRKALLLLKKPRKPV